MNPSPTKFRPLMSGCLAVAMAVLLSVSVAVGGAHADYSHDFYTYTNGNVQGNAYVYAPNCYTGAAGQSAGQASAQFAASRSTAGWLAVVWYARPVGTTTWTPLGAVPQDRYTQANTWNTFTISFTGHGNYEVAVALFAGSARGNYPAGPNLFRPSEYANYWYQTGYTFGGQPGWNPRPLESSCWL